MLDPSIRTACPRSYRRNLSFVAQIALGVFLAIVAAGCAPEVGSERWCSQMNEKPKADWSTNDAAEFAKSCIFK